MSVYAALFATKHRLRITTLVMCRRLRVGFEPWMASYGRCAGGTRNENKYDLRFESGDSPKLVRCDAHRRTRPAWARLSNENTSRPLWLERHADECVQSSGGQFYGGRSIFW